eukprot:7111465-Pyramimonas_sp.AAC.1
MGERANSLPVVPALLHGPARCKLLVTLRGSGAPTQQYLSHTGFEWLPGLSLKTAAAQRGAFSAELARRIWTSPLPRTSVP